MRGTRWTTRKLMIGIGLLALPLAALAILTRRDEGPPVTIIVPRAFRGPVSIVEDPGVEPVAFVNGAYVFRIPASGTLRVRSLDPFHRWHGETATWDDGTALPKCDHPVHVPRNVLALAGGRSVTSETGHRMEYFVGRGGDAPPSW